MSDEFMHSVGDDPAWSESFYFNFVDPRTKIGMFTRMGFRPGSGWADALHVLYLGGSRVAFTYGRREIGKDLQTYDGDLSAGDLHIECIDAHKQWRIQYVGPAQDIPDAEILLQRRKTRSENWFTPAHLDMDLTFECTTEPHFAHKGAHGHFEQSGHITGSIAMNDENWQVDGYGVRDKSWGPRDWGAGQSVSSDAPTETAPSGPAPFVNWFSMNFGNLASLGGSCFRHPDGVLRGEGWLQRAGESTVLKNIIVTSSYKLNSIVHKNIVLTAETATGEALEITGKILNVCPTKIAMPGGATFVNEGLAEFSWGELTGYGIAEHWHAIKL